jgi:hypothetical protein
MAKSSFVKILQKKFGYDNFVKIFNK